MHNLSIHLHSTNAHQSQPLSQLREAGLHLVIDSRVYYLWFS